MGISSEQSAGYLGATGTNQSRKTEDFALLDLEGDVVDNLDCRQVLDAQDDLVGDRLGGGARVGGHLATDHHLDNLTHGRGSRLNRADVLAVAQHGDAVGQLGKLGHAVRNEDQTGRRADKIAHEFKQRLGLGRRQRSRGLVHDEDL